MRHILLLNPTAGRGDRTDALRREAERVFAARGEPYEILTGKYPGHVRELARAVAGQGEKAVVYACGGDGTLSEAASGLAGSRICALAPVAIGSGNDFVRYFGEDAEERFRSLQALADGVSRPIDLLRVGDLVCLNIASAGFDAAVCARMPAFRRLPFVSGPAAYRLALTEGFLTRIRHRFAFEIDGRAVPAEEYVFAVAANGSFYGGGFHAAPRASLTDGLIDLVRVPALPRLRMLRLVGAYRRGEHLDRFPFVRFERCRSVRFLSDAPIEMNLDGEIVSLSDPLVTIDPGALLLRVPAAFADKI